MKNFDLELAKAGAKVCTREGDKARIICFDRLDTTFPIIVLIKNDALDTEIVFQYTITGKSSYYGCVESGTDLMMCDDE